MTAILGINAFHADASACLLRDGVLVAAVEEERFRRIKHWAGLPVESIRFCLAEGGLALRDLAIVAVNSDARANLLGKARYALASRPHPHMVLDRLRSRAKRRSLAESIEEQVKGGPFRGEVVSVEHHLAHLASAFYVSPFQRAVALSVDGSGDFATTAWGSGEAERVHCHGRVLFPHSLGIFYETITHFLGFKRYGDEYKVMGLAAYGRPSLRAAMDRILVAEPDGGFRLALEYFNHHTGDTTFQWDGCAPHADDYFTPAMAELLGPPREPDAPVEQHHRDIARSAQAAYERILFRLLERLHGRYGLDDLVLAGGCAFNSVANGRIYRRTPIRRLYVQPAAGDAGGALGAALHAWHARCAGPRRTVMGHAFWGPGYSDARIDAAIEARRNEIASGARRVRLERADLVRHVAASIAGGKVVGWFQGRMEWGPRALGNRSIVADPRRADIREILNEKIKRRESFRPFAPAILRERTAEWFETDDDVPFMTHVFEVKPEQRARIPAVTHVDGTGRLQTVEKGSHPLFHGLISAFEELTGVPILLNTSFNENEPIVCTPEEAIDCFLRTGMDMLVLGDRVIERDEQGPGASRESRAAAATGVCDE